jgi:hypothetical protein
MWTRAEKVLAAGLVAVAVGGAIWPYGIVGLLGALFLVIGLAVLAVGGMILRNRGVSRGRAEWGIVLQCVAAFGLFLGPSVVRIIWMVLQLSLEVADAVEISRLMFLLVLSLGPPLLFARGLRLTADFTTARCVVWALAVVAVGLVKDFAMSYLLRV